MEHTSQAHNYTAWYPVIIVTTRRGTPYHGYQSGDRVHPARMDTHTQKLDGIRDTTQNSDTTVTGHTDRSQAVDSSTPFS